MKKGTAFLIALAGFLAGTVAGIVGGFLLSPVKNGMGNNSTVHYHSGDEKVR